MNHPKAMSITVTSIMLATALAYAQPAAPTPPAEVPAAVPPAAAPEPPPPPPKPATPPPPIANKFQFTIYGFGQLDIIHDNTSSLPEGASQTVLPRPPMAGTPA